MSDNPEKVSFPFHLGGPGTMTADKQFSIYVSRTLDCLGKNQDMVNYRVKKYRELQEHYNIIYGPCIFAGSKAEGLTSVYESDTDIMIVFPDVICADNVIPFIHNIHTTVFQTDRHDLQAGYTKLKLVKFDTAASSEIHDSLYGNASEDTYLSSDLFITTIAKGLFKRFSTDSVNLHERSGPSLPISYREGYVHEDKVLALRCVCPTFLQSFLTRPRPYNRLSRDKLRDISVMDAHVVPVGHKKSNESHNEWRICFTKAEIYLIQILNETERKLYILLKMVSKLLKFISKDITSYVMKNIVLWLVELNPADLFTEDLLTYQLIQALRFLQKCVDAGFLPSFMIPKRNLFSEQLNPVQKYKLTTFLSTLIEERGYLLLRCEKLRDGMTILYREPDMAEEFRWRRDMADKFYLFWDINIFKKMAATGLSEEEVLRQKGDSTQIEEDILEIEILCPEFRLFLWQGCRRSVAQTFRNICEERHFQLLS